MIEKINKKDIEKVLGLYRLGSLISIKKVKRDIPTQQACFIIKTEKGKFFLKKYSDFNYNKRKLP